MSQGNSFDMICFSYLKANHMNLFRHFVTNSSYSFFITSDPSFCYPNLFASDPTPPTSHFSDNSSMHNSVPCATMVISTNMYTADA